MVWKRMSGVAVLTLTATLSLSFVGAAALASCSIENAASTSRTPAESSSVSTGNDINRSEFAAFQKDAYAAYLGLIDELRASYGDSRVVMDADDTWHRTDGLCFAKLYDLGGDVESLVIARSNTDDAASHTIEVWSYQGDELVKNREIPARVDLKGTQGVQLCNVNDKWYFRDNETNESQIDYCRYDGGDFVVARSLAWSYDGSHYAIDGITATRDEWRSASEEMERGKENYFVAVYREDYTTSDSINNLEVSLNRTVDTVAKTESELSRIL